MTVSWIKALDAYSYPVDLQKYKNAKKFPGFFNGDIIGNRRSTMDFEKYFRKKAPTRIEPYLEVTYWKQYFRDPDNQTDIRWRQIMERGTTAAELWQVVQQFASEQTVENLQKIWIAFGYSSNVLATPLTFPVLASPETIPMIDMLVAKWVNKNLKQHNINRTCELTPFHISDSSPLKGTDHNFESYVYWVRWCREVSTVLTDLNSKPWRARDVEMAVYTAERSKGKLDLEPLPPFKD